jgi:HK97 gp10 family phage protein
MAAGKGKGGGGITIEGTDRVIKLLAYLSGDLSNTATTVLNQVTRDVTDTMKKNAPVATGFLRNNITSTVSGTKAEVHSKAEYSGFVNYGTSRMAARAFFSNAVTYAQQQLRKTMFDEVKRDIMSK